MIEAATAYLARVGRMYSDRRVLTALAAVLLVVAATGLRIYAAGRSLWLDETISVFQVERPVRGILEAQVNGFHPPLYHLSLHAWIMAFGDTPLAIRSLSIVWSLVGVAAIAAWSREAFPDTPAWPAASLAAIGPFAVWYGSEARMYAQLLALTAVAGWLAWRILRQGSSFVRVGAFATAATALIYTHYFAMLFIATLGVVVLVTAARSLALRSRALAVVAGLAIAIGFFAPWIVYVVAHRQPNGAGPEYADPDLFSVFVAALEMVLGFHSTTSVGILAAGWPALCLLAFVLLPKMRQVPWRIGGLLALVALPPALLVLVSAVGRNVFDPRYLTVAVAPLYLLLGALWGGIPAGRAKLAGSVALVGLAVAGSVIQVRDPSNPKLFELREALRGAAAATDPGDVLVLVPDFQRRPVMHYYEPSSGVRVVAATRAAETWRDAVSDDPRRVVLISTFEDEALGERDRGPAEYRRYFAARGELVSKQPYINATVRVYRPYGTTG